MKVETTFRILGYPGLAIVLFLAAAGGGAALVIEILMADRKHRLQANRARSEPHSSNTEV